MSNKAGSNPLNIGSKPAANRRQRVTISQFSRTGVDVRLKSLSRGRWAFICGTSVGVLAAFPLAAPLFDGKILEPVATMWGSALGAMAAVAGALWVADRQATQQQRSAAALVRAMLHPVAFSLDELNMVYGPPSRPHRGETNDEPDILSGDEWVNVCEHAQFVIDHYKDFQSKIHRFETGLNLLSASGLQAALTIESELDEGINRAVGPLVIGNGLDPIYGPGHGFGPGAPTWTSRFAITVLNQHVQKGMAQLEREAL